MRTVRATCVVVPPAGTAVAAIDRGDLGTLRERAGGGDERMRRAEDLVLRLRGEVRGELVRVAGPQLPRPAHARVSAGDLDRDAEERLEVGLEPPDRKSTRLNSSH